MSVYVLNRPPVRNDFNDGADPPPSSNVLVRPSAYMFTFWRSAKFSERQPITVFSRFFSGVALRQVTMENVAAFTPQQRDAYAQYGAMRMTKTMCQRGSLEIGPYSADVADTIYGQVESYLSARCSDGCGRLPFRLDKK